MADRPLGVPRFSSFAYPAGGYLRFCTIGHGPHTILFLHGFAASLHTWDDLLPYFDHERFTLHLLDLKGHGGSCRPLRGDYSATHNIQLVTAFIRSLSVRQVTVVGHSMGGGLALLAALDCPEIARLVLIGAPAYPQPIPPFMSRLSRPVIGPLLLACLPARLVAHEGLKSVFYRHELITARHIERYAPGYRGFAAACALSRTVRQIVPEHLDSLVARYPDLTIPVLLVWGDHDEVVPLWQAERLGRDLPGARLAIIENCGHNPHEECPAETSAVMAPFLDSAALTSPQAADR